VFHSFACFIEIGDLLLVIVRNDGSGDISFNTICMISKMRQKTLKEKMLLYYNHIRSTLSSFSDFLCGGFAISIGSTMKL
jgi:hypothetical protein